MLRTALLLLCGVMLPLAAVTPATDVDSAEPAGVEVVLGELALAEAAPARIALAEAPFAQAPAETALKVTVQYTGAGQVTADKRLWVWLFGQAPDPAAHVEPLATQSLSRNGEVASFTGIAASQVWVAVMYDQNGGYMADGPPPSGSPASAHLVNGQQAPVATSPTAAITITFNDQYRLP
jgi:hypothetical protein